MEQFKMFKISTFFLLLIGLQKSQAGIFAIFGGLESIRAIASFADDVSDVNNGEVPFGALLIGSEDYKLDQVLDKVDEISKQVAELTQTVNTKMDKVLTVLLDRLPLQGKLDKAMNEFHSMIVRVDGLWAQYKKISKKIKKYNKRTVKAFIKSVTSFDTGDLPNVLNKMHRLFVPSTSGYFQDGLLQTLSNFQNTFEITELCNLDYSFQQRLYKIYQTIVTTEIRGFVMTVFVYMYLTVKEKDPFPAELKGAVGNLVLRSHDYIKTVQSEMKKASREIKFCGVERLTLANLEEFTGLYSLVVLNEQQLSKDKSCSGECNDKSASAVYHKYNPISDNPRDRRLREYDYFPRIDCEGKIFDCGWIGTTTICDMPWWSPKRYQWVQTENGRYGSNGDCMGVKTKSLSPRYDDWLYWCDMCFCTCIQESSTTKADRAFSLRPQVSDTENNMVIIGVKLEGKDRLIHIRIQKGKLLPGGEIDKKTEEWVELEDFVYLDNVTDGGFSLANGESLTRGKDFTFITSEQKSLNLDDVLLTSDYVLTGVRFNHETEGDFNSRVRLEIRGTKFSWGEGKLDQDQYASRWVNVDIMQIDLPEYKGMRTGYVYSNDPGDPTESSLNDQLSKPNQWVGFIASSGWKTAGLYTLPMFDIRPVTATPSVPLGGAGIYLKNGEDSGGIVALKVFTPELSGIISPVLSEEEIQKYQNDVSAEEEDEDEEEEEEEDEDEDEYEDE